MAAAHATTQIDTGMMKAEIEVARGGDVCVAWVP